jgi:redox-sensitive bicupin YhaK (pirin superfamily)
MGPELQRRSQVEVHEPRAVPLGGLRAMIVHRTLPTRQRPLVGAWCFLDHYGPDDVATTGGMQVRPHPHSGLQTVTWLFDGAVEHRDSGGGAAVVAPGELSLMTAGDGIAHSEMSTPGTLVLHGVQLWVALPEGARGAPRGYTHLQVPSVDLEGAQVRVFVGELAGARSPAPTYSPLLGAEVVLAPHATLDLGVDEGFEHAVLVDVGRVRLVDTELAPRELGYVAPGPSRLTLVNPTDETTRLVLLGGEPFGEPIVMWWNFVGRTHEDVESMRADWAAGSPRYGEVPGWEPGDRLPAPELPRVRIRPRGAGA